MTLDQLRIFIAVAEREHITRTAEFLNLTQSAVSHAVTSLEREFQVALFSRVGRRIELTQVGRLLLSDARTLLSQADTTRRHLLELGSLKQGLLHVHVSRTIADYWLPARLNLFHTRHPTIELHVTIANTHDVCGAVARGAAGLGLIEGEATQADLTIRTVAVDQMILVVSPNHPWAAHPPALADLPRSPWVLREKGSGTRSEFENAIACQGIDPAALPVMMEISSNEALASTVETGRAATALSASVVAGRLEAGLLHHVPFSLPERQFQLVQHPQRALSPAEKAFLKLVCPEAP